MFTIMFSSIMIIIKILRAVVVRYSLSLSPHIFSSIVTIVAVVVRCSLSCSRHIFIVTRSSREIIIFLVNDFLLSVHMCIRTLNYYLLRVLPCNFLTSLLSRSSSESGCNLDFLSENKINCGPERREIIEETQEKVDSSTAMSSRLSGKSYNVSAAD